GVAGEQYALPDVVARLRRVRDNESRGHWVVLSAADPLNLVGILTPGMRLPATRSNALIVRDGRLIATRQGGEINFLVDVPADQRQRMTRALRVIGPRR